MDKISDVMVEEMCRAFWPTWDRMRPDNQRAWRVKMAAALRKTFG